MKTLVDTSVWLEYFKGDADELEKLLQENSVLMHSIVIGELSCGNLKNREKTLGDLKLLPKVSEAQFGEAIELIERHRLHGKGLGFGDVQLLASALISGCLLLTFDRALNTVARQLIPHPRSHSRS